jgi:rhamnose utilization protein RhaD (predicted bifunctional aldolase and dehydrogenase)
MLGSDFYLKLVDHSQKIGNDLTLVQGAGGNTSFKNEEFLWVKASGTKLSHAKNKDIFIKLDLEKAKKYSFSDDPKLIYNAVVEPLNENLRPSIETAMHSIINAPVVTHVHSLGSIGASISKNFQLEIERVSEVTNMAWIPYVRPGAELAKQISKTITPLNNSLLLGNHGMTVWGNTFEEVETLISNIENIWRSYHKILDKNFQKKSISENWAKILSAGILTPDEVVFLGREPFKLISEINLNNARIIINPNGKTIFDANLTEDSKNIAKVLMGLDGWVDDYETINYLGDEAIDSIVNWDMEKFRQEQNK